MSYTRPPGRGDRRPARIADAEARRVLAAYFAGKQVKQIAREMKKPLRTVTRLVDRGMKLWHEDRDGSIKKAREQARAAFDPNFTAPPVEVKVKRRKGPIERKKVFVEEPWESPATQSENTVVEIPAEQVGLGFTAPEARKQVSNDRTPVVSPASPQGDSAIIRSIIDQMKKPVSPAIPQARPEPRAETATERVDRIRREMHDRQVAENNASGIEEPAAFRVMRERARRAESPLMEGFE